MSWRVVLEVERVMAVVPWPVSIISKSDERNSVDVRQEKPFDRDEGRCVDWFPVCHGHVPSALAMALLPVRVRLYVRK